MTGVQRSPAGQRDLGQLPTVPGVLVGKLLCLSLLGLFLMSLALHRECSQQRVEIPDPQTWPGGLYHIAWINTVTKASYNQGGSLQ